MKSTKKTAFAIPYVVVCVCAIAVVAALFGAVCVSLSGCADPTSPDYALNSSSSSQGDTSQTAQGRRFTIPKEYFGDKTQAESIDTMKAEGATDITPNTDGSLTVTMSDTNFNAFVAKLKTQTQKALEAIPDNESFNKAISKVSYNESLTELTMISGDENIGNTGKKAADYAIYLVCLYQTIAGEQLSCHVVINNPAGTELAHYSYPS